MCGDYLVVIPMTDVLVHSSRLTEGPGWVDFTWEGEGRGALPCDLGSLLHSLRLTDGPRVLLGGVPKDLTPTYQRVFSFTKSRNTGLS